MNDRPIRWIVHIGPPKTGSTSIQLTLEANRGRLFDQGVCIPQSGWQHGQHAGLATALARGTVEVITEIRDEVLLSGAHTALISSEYLFPEVQGNPEAYVNSPLFAPGDSVLTVGFVRPLTSWLTSLWTQSLKTNEGMWIDTAIRAFQGDRWTRMLPTLEGVEWAALDRPDIDWTYLVLAATNADAHLQVLSLLDVDGIEELADSVPDANKSDTAWRALTRWCWLQEGRGKRHQATQAPTLAPSGEAARLLSRLPVRGLLSPEDRQWLEEQTNEWLGSEVDVLVKRGWLDPQMAAYVTKRSRALAPVDTEWDTVVEAIEAATEELHVAATRKPPAPVPAPPASGPRVGTFANITVLPYRGLSGRRAIEGGPAFPDFATRDFERQRRFGRPADSLPAALPGVDTYLPGEYVWAGPVVGHFGYQVAEFSHRVVTGLQAAPGARVLVACQADDAGPRSWRGESAATLPVHVRELFDYLGVPTGRIDVVSRPVAVESLVVAEQGQQLGVAAHPQYLEALQTLAQWPPGFDYPVLYVSRAGHPMGGLAGETYLEHAIEAAGGMVMRPEEFSVVQQLRAYVGAETVLFAEGSAIHGAGLLGRALGDVIVINRRHGNEATWRAELTPRARRTTFIDAIETESSDAFGMTVLDPARLVQQLLVQGLDIRGSFDDGEFAEAVRIDLARTQPLVQLAV